MNQSEVIIRNGLNTSCLYSYIHNKVFILNLSLNFWESFGIQAFLQVVTYKCYDNGHDLGSHTSTKLYIYKWWECWLTRSSQRALPYKIGTFLIQTVGFQWRNHYHAVGLMTQNTLEMLRGSLVWTLFFLIALDHQTWVIKSSHPLGYINPVHITKTNFYYYFKNRIPEYFIRDTVPNKRDIYTKPINVLSIEI